MSTRRQLSSPSVRPRAPRLVSILYVTLVLLIMLSAFVFVRVPDSVKSYIYGLFRDMARVQMLLRTHGWQQMQDDLFIVRYRDDESGARLVQETSHMVYDLVYEDFSYLPGLKIPKIPIVVYPSRAELNASFGWPASENAMGVYWGGVIRVLTPQAWINENDPEALRQVFRQSGPMAHELTHLVLDYAARGNYPRWFTEGVAQYQEYKITGYIFGAQEGIWDRGVYPFNKMDRQFDKLSNQALAYRESLSVVQYIVSVYGEEGLHNIIKNLARGASFNDALENALELNLEGLEREWREWLAGELHQPLSTNQEEQL